VIIFSFKLISDVELKLVAEQSPVIATVEPFQVKFEEPEKIPEAFLN
jgi:hypothetical protein